MDSLDVMFEQQCGDNSFLLQGQRDSEETVLVPD